MSTNRKASITKRARELAQKDGVRDREARRAERKARKAERAASGIVGPEIADPQPPLTPSLTDDVGVGSPEG